MKTTPLRSLTVSPGSPMRRFTNVPPSPHRCAASEGVLKTMISPRLRNRPAAELRRSRVMGILESAAELGREALELAGSLGEGAGQAPGHGVQHHHRRQVAVREDVRPDRDRVAREMLDDPLVEAF